MRTRERGERRMREVRCAAQLDRANPGRGRSRERLRNELLVERRGTGGTKRRNEACLHLAGDRRLGEHQDRSQP